jgi:hypothetical protein
MRTRTSLTCVNGHLWSENLEFYGRKNKARCRSCHRLSSMHDSAMVKVDVLAHYGPQGVLRCCWPGCSIDDVDMLSLDHINNDGAAHRRKTNTSGTHFYRQLRAAKFPSGFQTLCHNHQWKKELMRRRGE